jgi:hypothetical protein
MKRWIAAVLAGVAIAASGVETQQLPGDEQRALRDRLQARYDVVVVTDGLVLRPKARDGSLRFIEVSDAGVSINGEPASGAEVRDRLGADAADVLRLSLLPADARRALFAPPPTPAVGPETPVEAAKPPDPGPRRRYRRGSGDRVRIFGNVEVRRDEVVDGQVVAVMGSVRVDGEAGDQVVAVLGSVDLGPEAVVRGDIVSVGGVVRRSPTAQVHGGVTEVALFDGQRIHVDPWVTTWMPFYFFDGFGALPRLVGSSMRLGLLVLLTLLALVVARPTVERTAARLNDNPVKALVVGILAQALIIPVLVLTCIVLAITIIGIPLIFLGMPFVVLLLVLMAIAGFSGTACAVGQWTRRRFGSANVSPFLDVALGVVVVLMPLMLGRVLALAGWPMTPVVALLVAAGFALELLAWSSGFGAVLTNIFSRWQARRAVRATAVTPPVGP